MAPIFSGAMENCFMIRSSPATAMLIRFRWLMKQSAMSKATIRQGTGVGWLRAESIGGFTGVQSSKSKVQSSKEIRRSKHQPEPLEPAYEAWRLEFIGIWNLGLFISPTPRPDTF